MPAILEDSDWATWLGENDAAPEQAKAVLRTMEGVNWQLAPERKTATPGKKGSAGGSSQPHPGGPPMTDKAISPLR
jgi:putative SOS response-associated peptidase YedK